MVDENVDLKAIGVQATNKDELISLFTSVVWFKKISVKNPYRRITPSIGVYIIY